MIQAMAVINNPIITITPIPDIVDKQNISCVYLRSKVKTFNNLRALK